MPTVRIDRIEGDLAVLVHERRPFELPRALLPADAREGDLLELTLVRDVAATDAERQRLGAKRARLSKDDDGGDFSL